MDPNRSRLTTVLVVLALGGVLWLFAELRFGTVAADRGVPRLAGQARAPVRDGSRERLAPPAREPAPRAEVPPTTASTPLTGARPEKLTGAWLRGVVEDLDGRRVPLAEVRFRPAGDELAAHDAQPPVLSTSCDAGGAFALDVPSVHGCLQATGQRFVTVLAPEVGVPADTARPYTIVVAPLTLVSGRVVDDEGAPLAGALVQWRLPSSALSARVASERSRPVEASTRTDERGGFELARCPAVPASQVWGFAAGFRPAAVDAPEGFGEPVLLRLSPLPKGEVACGLVVDADGAPSAGALVSFGAVVVESGPDGVFCMDLADSWAANLSRTQPIEVMALKDGFRSERLRLPSFEAGLAAAWPSPLVLRLDSARLSVRGHVLDAQGKPLAGVVVSLLDPTDFGYRELTPGSGLYAKSATEFSAGASGSSRTRRDGAFWLDGLEPREYTLEVLDEDSLACVRSGPVLAGTEDVTIRFAPAVVILGGRVVSSTGRPLPDVRLAVTKESSQRGLLVGNGVTSAADGTFLLGPVPAQDACLRLEGEPILPVLLWKVPAGELDDLTIVLERRLSLRIDWSTVSAKASQLCLYDAAGGRLPCMLLQGLSVALEDGIPLRSEEVHVVSETAAFAAVLGDDGVELQRATLASTPDSVQLVRF